MKFNHKKTRFGHHKTFPLRYSWLTQDFMAVKRTPTLFSQPEQAMITLGVGWNMVNTIQYWLRAN